MMFGGAPAPPSGGGMVRVRTVEGDALSVAAYEAACERFGQMSFGGSGHSGMYLPMAPMAHPALMPPSPPAAVGGSHASAPAGAGGGRGKWRKPKPQRGPEPRPAAAAPAGAGSRAPSPIRPRSPDFHPDFPNRNSAPAPAVAGSTP